MLKFLMDLRSLSGFESSIEIQGFESDLIPNLLNFMISKNIKIKFMEGIRIRFLTNFSLIYRWLCSKGAKICKKIKPVEID